MNLKSYDKSTRVLKMAQLAARGTTFPGEGNMPLVGIIDCSQKNTGTIMQNLVSGVQHANGAALTFQIPNYDSLQRLAPATAKYAHSYLDFVAKHTEALIRTNLLDGVIAVVDNYVMAQGILQGCTKANCALLLQSTGLNPNYDESILATTGRMAIREIKSTELDYAALAYAGSTGVNPHDTLTTAYFQLCTLFDLMLPENLTAQANTGALLQLCQLTGNTAVQRADDIITPKRLISKKTLTEVLTKYQEQKLPAAGVLLMQDLFRQLELKMPANLFPTMKGLAEEAYVTAEPTAPLTISGQAWVYRSLTDAMTALTLNAIENGVIVLQNCVDCDVTLVAKTIATMRKTDTIALITDGYCAATPVLTVANITPNAFANEDFANIQNGDTIEIDVAKGRLNTNVTSKELKTRAKRNIAKKYEIYF